MCESEFGKEKKSEESFLTFRRVTKHTRFDIIENNDEQRGECSERFLSFSY